METRLYRARSREHDGWVYGYLTLTVLDIPVIRDLGRCRMIAIDPLTIGQDTGIRDRNGQTIFEGDLIRIGRCSALFEVRWNPRLARYQAYAQGSPVTRDLKGINQKSYETITNLWESASNAAGAPSTAAAEESPNTGAPSAERASAD